ncbi:hypothetical protein V2J09_014590 [Rumex salicifolius]
MDTQSAGDATGDSIAAIKDTRQQIEARVDSLRSEQQELIASLQTLVPDLVSSLNLSLEFISTFNRRPFIPLSPPANPNPPSATRLLKKPTDNHKRPAHLAIEHKLKSVRAKSGSEADANRRTPGERGGVEEDGSPLSVVRSMVAAVLLERVPFSPIDSSTVLRKLENNQSASSAEKAALREVAGDSGILAVEMALRSMAEDNVGVELEEFVVSGKSRVLVMNIDRIKLMKELPESSQHQQQLLVNSKDPFSAGGGGDGNLSPFQMGPGPSPRPPMPEMWSMRPGGIMFPGPPGTGSLMGPAGGPRGMGMMGMARAMGMPHQHRPPFAPMGGPNAAVQGKANSDEDVMKDLEVLLNKKSFKEMQKSKTGEELLDLIHRPTAKETAVAAKVHFRRIIAPHTDINLGDCSFLDTCRHMKTCKYVHYELDPTPDVMGALPLSKPLKPQRAEYCSEVELGESQWINCDIRNFRMDILGQFGVIMADPPWDIHMELPYGTMADDEMRTLNVPALQTDGLIFLWVTGRAMELGRECLDLWGYKRVEEIIWVKTNQLQRIIRTGRTGHWLNHSKEHCLVGIKGSPLVNRNIDTDVVVAEVRETSRKPDEMYPLLERISPRTRKLELFARMHNTHAGWLSLGNQLSGARLVDEGLRARFRAAYPEVEIQPPSPPRSSAMEVDPAKNPFGDANFSQSPNPQPTYASQEKPSGQDVEMVA